MQSVGRCERMLVLARARLFEIIFGVVRIHQNARECQSRSARRLHCRVVEAGRIGFRGKANSADGILRGSGLDERSVNVRPLKVQAVGSDHAEFFPKLIFSPPLHSGVVRSVEECGDVLKAGQATINSNSTALRNTRLMMPMRSLMVLRHNF